VQLNAAADAAALAAAKTTADAFAAKLPNYIALGQAAGQLWFSSQATTVLNTNAPTASVAVTQSGSTFSSNVTYQATVPTYFARILGYTTVPVSGLSSATITANSYVEVLMLLDNSSSMAIAATTADIVKLEQATMCSTLPPAATQDMGNYSWTYTTGYGYVPPKPPPLAPPISPPNGACDSRYTGAAGTCFYPPASGLINSQGQCTNGGGTKGAFGPNTPQAPCAFACHTAASNDSYALSVSLGVTLRMNVVRDAAANVIATLQSSQTTPGLFAVGVYSFRSNYAQVYPTNGSEAGTALQTAQQIVSTMTPPIVTNDGDTDFTTSADNLAQAIQPAGNGSSAAAALKNL
jgi:hypothetical protein